jgi:hypothetical protein
MGLSILAGGLAFVGSANAADLIVNGSFEDGGVGWVGTFGTYNYSAAYYAGPPVPASENPGSSYSWRHGLPDGTFGGPLIQDVNLSPTLNTSDIDAGRSVYVLSAWMASYTSDPERPYVTVQFYDQTAAPLGSLVALDRAGSAGFTTFADGTTVFDDVAHRHNWAKYIRNGGIPPGARTARVGVTHSPNAGLGGRPDTYTDLVKLDVVSVAFVPPLVETTQPTGSSVSPAAAVSVGIRDGTTQLNPGTLQFSLDGTGVLPSIVKVGPLTTLNYAPPGLFAPGAHTVRVIFSDNGTTAFTQTNQFTFTVVSYYNILLPAPLHFENFEGTAEGGLPAGWTQVSYSAVPDPNFDLQDLNSASYATWTVVNSTRFTQPMLTYGSHTPETDYQRVLSFNSANVVNGVVVSNLAQGNICFGDAGYRDGGSQVLYLSSPDYDLTGQTSVYLSFHSIWEQNQDSIGAVEYSIDEGATWLPVVYYLASADVLRDSQGVVDARATFAATYGDVATYVDPADQLTKGGYYGAFIGVASNDWSGLGSYISSRVDDNPVESKRIEIFPLPRAANQAKVRIRFAHAGTDSWYFGLDNVGLYSISVVTAPTVGITPANQTERVGNTVFFNANVAGLGPFTYQWRFGDANLSGATNSTLARTDLQLAQAGNYSLVVGYLGGATTSAPAALTVMAPANASVIGQWDFLDEDFRATVGAELEPADGPVFFDTSFGSSDVFLGPDEGGTIDGVAFKVMGFPGAVFGGFSAGYRMSHGLGGTGGGTNVNSYTLIADLLYPAAANNVIRGILQTHPDNLDNVDIYLNEANGLGVSGVFQGSFLPDTWQRVAVAVDLAGPGPNPIMTKFINGVKVGQQTLTEGVDGRWSLSTNPDKPWALLFADDDGGVQPGFVSSIQLRSGRLSDAEIAHLGRATANKIPGAITSRRQAGSIVIQWSGGVGLQGADNLTGPWSDVAGATSPYVTGPIGARKFYRPKL